jgi:hypothetical protein
MMNEKIDALDLIINVLRDHEEALNNSVFRLEEIKGEKPTRSTSEQLLSTAKEILNMSKFKGCDVNIRVNVSKNEYLEMDIWNKKRKKTRALQGGGSVVANPVLTI